MTLPLLLAQDVQPTYLAVIVTISSLVGAAAQWAAGMWMRTRKESRAEKQKEELRVSEHLRQALERCQAECKECRAENHLLRGDTQELVNLKALQGAHIRYLETLLQQRRIVFKPFRYGDDEEPADDGHNRRNTPPEGYPSGS